MLREGWMRAAVLAAVLVVLVFYTFFRGVPERSTVDRLEERLATATIEGAGARPVQVSDYVRYYAETKPRRWDDLGFTMPPPDGLAPPAGGKAVIAGVLVLPGVTERGRPGIRRVRADNLPIIGDGGCSVVNVLYDPARDELLAAWCNHRVDPRPDSPRR